MHKLVGRPAVLLLVSPSPRLNDSIADPRLVVAGSYEGGLRAVLPVVLIGLVSFLLVATTASRGLEPRGIVRGAGLRDVAVLYAAGWACRLLVGGGFENPLTSSAMGLAPLAAILAVLALGRLSRGPAWLPRPRRCAARGCGPGSTRARRRSWPSCSRSA